MLNSKLFMRIQLRFGSLEIDLFASRASTQLFFSWRPNPVAKATDAFSQFCMESVMPIPMGSNPLGIVTDENAEGQCSAHSTSVEWYSVLLSLLVDYP